MEKSSHIQPSKIAKLPYKKLLLLIVTLFFLSAAINYYFVSKPQGDETHYLVISQTIRIYRSLDVGKNYENKNYNSFFEGTLEPHYITRPNGLALPTHGIGGPILWLPLFILLGRFGAILFITGVSILTVLFTYEVFRELEIRESISFIVSVSLSLGSVIFLFSHLTFIEPIAMLIVIYTFLKLIQKERLKPLDLIIVGSFLAFLHWLHLRFLVIEIPFFVLLFLKIVNYSNQKTLTQRIWSKSRASLYFILPFLASTLLYELYYLFIWGNLNPFVSLAGQGGRALPLRGLVGMFFDRQFGLLVSSPIFALLPVGVYALFKSKYKSLLLIMIVIMVPYVLLFTSVGPAWGGGWSPPTRYLLSFVPLLSIFIAKGLNDFNNKLTQSIFLTLAFLGFLYNHFSLMSTAHGFNGEGSMTNQTINFVKDYLFNHKIDFNRFLPSLYDPLNLNVLVIWILVILLINVIFLSSPRVVKRIKDFSSAKN